ncbi:MAG: hypothetical protein JSW18_03820 [Candidatus Omnitrophota bacterium]|nr:MAG: hypothetical protein JSW18_03820 [Candidatus Omnitrophota bacterium]
MRKILIFLVCMFFLNLSISLTFADGADAKIIYLKGQVKLQRAKDTNWIVAKEGMAIKRGDRIRTFKFSAVKIATDKDAKNVIRIEQESEFLFEGIAVNKHKLFRGKVFALLEALEPGSSFEVHTPTAVCGVAGSGIFVHTDGNKTTAGCHEDEAYAKGIKKDGSLTAERIIKEGHTCTIGKFKAPGPLIALTRFEQKEWSRFREELSKLLERLKGEMRSEERKIIDRIKKLQDRSDKRIEIQRQDRFEKREQEKREEVTRDLSTS